MKNWILWGALLLCGAACGVARGEETTKLGHKNAFLEVPRDHWSILASLKLNQLCFPEILPVETNKSQNVARYYFAVTAARIIDKYGYEPQFTADSGIDGVLVRDALVALLYEYRDEFMILGVTDPLTSGRWEIEAYLRAKENHRSMDASQWYFYAKDQPWKKDIVISVSRSVPRIVSPPSIKIPFPEGFQKFIEK